jgi:4-amino-4-deoxy-L-arabinose transferase-like glycosyltransferase
MLQPLSRLLLQQKPLAGPGNARGLSDYLAGQMRRALAIKVSPAQSPIALAQRLTSARQTSTARLSQLARDRWLLAAVAISVVALVLRLIGDAFGLPAHFHWDEPTIVNRAVRMGNGDLNPHFFYYPGLTFYITFACEAALYLVGHLLHVYLSTTAYAAAYFTDSTPFYLTGRVLGAVLGAATCLLCYLLGKRVFSPVVGLMAEGLLAVSVVSVANAHFITNDVPMAFFVMLAYLFIWRVYTHGSRSNYVLAGVAIGLGIATKYLPAVLFASLALAHVLREHRKTGHWRPSLRSLAPLALSGAVMLLTFFAASPFSFLDWRNALHDYAAQGQLSSAAGDATAPLNFVPYLTATLPWSIGWPAYLAALGGLVALARAQGARRWELLLFVSFPVLYFLMIGSARQPWARWLVTLQPFLALSAAALVWWCAQQAPKLRQRYLPAWRASVATVKWSVLGTMLLLLLLPPTIASLRFDGYLRLTDARAQAAAWVSGHIPTSATIAVQPLFDRYFLTAPIMTTRQLAQLDGEIPASKPDVRQIVDAYYRAHPLYHDVQFVYDLAKLRTEGVRYVVLSSASTHNSGDITAEDRFYAALHAQGTVVARFGPPAALPDADNYPVSSPIITIYALPATP